MAALRNKFFAEAELHDGTHVEVREIDEKAVDQLAALNTKILSRMEASLRGAFFKHDADWYKEFIGRGNKAFGLYDEAGKLISKAGLVTVDENLTPYGLNKTSATHRVLGDHAGPHGPLGIVSLLGTDPDNTSKGAMRTLLNGVFSYAADRTEKSMLIASVLVSNIPSLKVLVKSGMRVTEASADENTRFQYFHLSGVLKKMMMDEPLKVSAEDVIALNGSISDIRKKLANREERIAIPLDIPPGYADNPYRASNFRVMIDAFDSGYSGRKIKTLAPEEEGDAARNYMIMELGSGSGVSLKDAETEDADTADLPSTDTEFSGYSPEAAVG